MNIFITIVCGVAVFVLGQIILKLLIEPIQKLRETIAEVAFRLANDHGVIHNAEISAREQAQAASSNLTQLDARLLSGQQLIPFYSRLRRFFSLPEQGNIVQAAQTLSIIPRLMYGNDPKKFYRLDLHRKEICELLHLQDPIINTISKKELLDAIREN